MTLIRDLNDQAIQAARGGAISIGNFDGVHQGHAVLLAQLREAAKQAQGPAVVFTFDPHPATILRPDKPHKPLTVIERRAELIAAEGIDHVIACRPTPQLLGLTATEFFEDVLRDKLHVKAMAEGPNFFFGKDRGGDIDLLKNLCHGSGIDLSVVSAQESDGTMVSSTVIRGFIALGSIDQANQLLTAPYRVEGKVSGGAGRGADLGFPTANLIEIPTVVPGQGVYAGKCYLPSGTFAAAIHIGPNPTFEEGPDKVEVHLIDFDGDLYDRNLEIELLSRIRSVTKFANVNQLVSQVKSDIASAKRIAKL